MRSTGVRTLSIAVLTAAIALFASVASAAAATIPIQGGEVDWGIKESFRSYVKGPIAGGQIEVSGGATEAADGTFRFPVGSGTYDLESHTTEVQGAGSVHFTGHFSGGVPALDLTLSDPRVVLGTATGTVYADLVSKSLMTGEFESFPGVEFATLDTSGVAPDFGEEAVTLSPIPAELTAAGAEAFAGFYAEGEALDPLGVTAAFDATPPPAEETPKPTEDKKTDDPPSSSAGSSSPGTPAPAPAVTMPTLKSAGGSMQVGNGGSATVATLVCPSGGSCTLTSPRTVKVKIGGKTFTAKVIAPHRVAGGSAAKVTVKLPAAALAELAGGKVKVSLKLVLGSGSQQSTKLVNATLKAKVS